MAMVGFRLRENNPRLTAAELQPDSENQARDEC